jgi:hypothetical protein
MSRDPLKYHREITEPPAHAGERTFVVSNVATTAITALYFLCRHDLWLFLGWIAAASVYAVLMIARLVDLAYPKSTLGDDPSPRTTNMGPGATPRRCGCSERREGIR